MGARHTLVRNTVPPRTVVLAILLLLGVLLMGAGYYQNSHLVLFVGLAVTLTCVLNLAFFLILWPTVSRIVRHRRH